MNVVNLASQTHFSAVKLQKSMVADTPQARMVLFCLEPGQQILPHTSTSAVSLYVVEGEATLHGSGEGTAVKAGTLVTYEPEESHGWRAETRLVVLATIAPAP
jgi:quercetin dioxygenase-like cupin family protein